MEKCIDYVIVYAAQTASDGIRYCRDPHAKLHASSATPIGTSRILLRRT